MKLNAQGSRPRFTYMVVKTLTDILLEKLRQEVNSEMKIGNCSAIRVA
jgi:hypothetical protein